MSAPQRIGAVIPDKSNLPPELIEKKNWILWGYVIENRGKETKVPFAPWRTGGELVKVSAPDPNNWESFDKAREWVGKFRGLGLGFVFCDTVKIAGMDLDDCIEGQKDGEPIFSEFARQILDKAGSYAEVSPSGKGIKVFLAEHTKRKKPLINHDVGVEVYDDKRFFAITGVKLKGAPRFLAEGDDLLHSIYKSWEKPPKRVDDGGNVGDGLNFPIIKLLGEEWLKKARTGGGWLRGPHPVHGSTHGTNFNVNLKTGGWFCFRCERGGGPLELLAVMEKLIDCDKLGEKGHRLRGELLRKAVKLAKERGWVGKDVHVARSFFNEDDSFVPLWLAERIMDDLPIITHRESWGIYHYKDGVYLPDGEATIRELTRRYLGEEAKDHYINETVKQIRDTTFKREEDFETDPDLLCVENGVLNVLTKELKPHTPSLIFLQKLPAKYNPAAKCPTVVRRLGEWTNLKGIVRISQFAGFCLYRDYFIRKALIIHGPGANGKTTLVGFLIKWLGQKNTSSIKVQNLEKRFTTARLFGKLANLCDDLPPDEWFGTGGFKQATGGSPLEGEKKFKDEFSFSSYAKLLFTGNKLPIVSDDSVAFWDRISIIPFEKRFDDAPENVKAERRNKIIEAMTTEEEKSGFLNIALEGLKTLVEVGEFYLPEDMEKTRAQYIKISDPVMAFSDAKTIESPEGKTSKAKIYAAYCDYCVANGFPVKENNAFARSFKRCHPRIEDTQIDNPNGGRINAWRGVALVDVEKRENGPEKAAKVGVSTRDTQDTHVFPLLVLLTENYELKEVREELEKIQHIVKKPVEPVEPVETLQIAPDGGISPSTPPFDQPVSTKLLDALKPYSGTGELLDRKKLASSLGCSLESLDFHLTELARRGHIIERGSVFEVV